MRVLILNADYTPYDIWGWQKAMKKLLDQDGSSVFVVKDSDDIIRDGKGNEYFVPSILVLKKYRGDQNKPATYTKANIYARDHLLCQYCGKLTARGERTVDHVIPKAYWKKHKLPHACSSFENVVTCCRTCNTKKRNRTPQQAGMILRRKPKAITRLQAYVAKLTLGYIHPDWYTYINGSLNVPKEERQ